MRFPKLNGLLGIVGSVLVASCAAQSVKTRVWMPAEFPEATKHKSFAVTQFEGTITYTFRDWWGASTTYRYQSGKNFSDALEAELAAARGPDEKLYFKPVDRTKLTKVLGELKLGQSGLADSKQAAQVGKMTGAQVLYTGSVKADTMADHQYYEEKQECAAEDKKGKCLRMRKISIRCVRRVGTVQATVKAVNVQTSNIVFSKNVNGTSEAKVCDGGKGDLPSATEARDAAMKDAVRQVVWAVAPHEMDLDLELLEMTDGIAGEANKAALSKGLDFAKRGRIDRACEEWKPAAAAEPKSPALLLNAGVCLEIAQKFTDALSYYNKADRLVGDMGGSSTAALAKLPGDMGKMFENAADPDKITQKAIKRVKEMMRKKEELRKQVN